MATNPETVNAAANLFKSFGSGGGGGGGGIASGAMGATPYGAAANMAMKLASTPPPSSAANLKNKNPLTINATGLNLGSILQPYTNAGPPNGGAGYNVSSPMGSASAVSVSKDVVLYGVAGAGLLIAVIFLVRK